MGDAGARQPAHQRYLLFLVGPHRIGEGGFEAVFLERRADAVHQLAAIDRAVIHKSDGVSLPVAQDDFGDPVRFGPV
ncbi:hypothetical protein D3C78_1862810 [compost metagenome]